MDSPEPLYAFAASSINTLQQTVDTIRSNEIALQARDVCKSWGKAVRTTRAKSIQAAQKIRDALAEKYEQSKQKNIYRQNKDETPSNDSSTSVIKEDPGKQKRPLEKVREQTNDNVQQIKYTPKNGLLDLFGSLPPLIMPVPGPPLDQGRLSTDEQPTRPSRPPRPPPTDQRSSNYGQPPKPAQPAMINHTNVSRERVSTQTEVTQATQTTHPYDSQPLGTPTHHINQEQETATDCSNCCIEKKIYSKLLQMILAQEIMPRQDDCSRYCQHAKRNRLEGPTPTRTCCRQSCTSPHCYSVNVKPEHSSCTCREQTRRIDLDQDNIYNMKKRRYQTVQFCITSTKNGVKRQLATLNFDTQRLNSMLGNDQTNESGTVSDSEETYDTCESYIDRREAPVKNRKKRRRFKTNSEGCCKTRLKDYHKRHFSVPTREIFPEPYSTNDQYLYQTREPRVGHISAYKQRNPDTLECIRRDRTETRCWNVPSSCCYDDNITNALTKMHTLNKRIQGTAKSINYEICRAERNKVVRATSRMTQPGMTTETYAGVDDNGTSVDHFRTCPNTNFNCSVSQTAPIVSCVKSFKHKIHKRTHIFARTHRVSPQATYSNQSRNRGKEFKFKSHDQNQSRIHSEREDGSENEPESGTSSNTYWSSLHTITSQHSLACNPVDTTVREPTTIKENIKADRLTSRYYKSEDCTKSSVSYTKSIPSSQLYFNEKHKLPDSNSGKSNDYYNTSKNVCETEHLESINNGESKRTSNKPIDRLCQRGENIEVEDISSSKLSSEVYYKEDPRSAQRHDRTESTYYEQCGCFDTRNEYCLEQIYFEKDYRSENRQHDSPTRNCDVVSEHLSEKDNPILLYSIDNSDEIYSTNNPKAESTSTEEGRTIPNDVTENTSPTFSNTSCGAPSSTFSSIHDQRRVESGTKTYNRTEYDYFEDLSHKASPNGNLHGSEGPKNPASEFDEIYERHTLEKTYTNHRDVNTIKPAVRKSNTGGKNAASSSTSDQTELVLRRKVGKEDGVHDKHRYSISYGRQTIFMNNVYSILPSSPPLETGRLFSSFKTYFGFADNKESNKENLNQESKSSIDQNSESDVTLSGIRDLSDVSSVIKDDKVPNPIPRKIKDNPSQQREEYPSPYKHPCFDCEEYRPENKISSDCLKTNDNKFKAKLWCNNSDHRAKQKSKCDQNQRIKQRYCRSNPNPKGETSKYSYSRCLEGYTRQIIKCDPKQRSKQSYTSPKRNPNLKEKISKRSSSCLDRDSGRNLDKSDRNLADEKNKSSKCVKNRKSFKKLKLNSRRDEEQDGGEKRRINKEKQVEGKEKCNQGCVERDMQSSCHDVTGCCQQEKIHDSTECCQSSISNKNNVNRDRSHPYVMCNVCTKCNVKPKCMVCGVSNTIRVCNICRKTFKCTFETVDQNCKCCVCNSVDSKLVCKLCRATSSSLNNEYRPEIEKKLVNVFKLKNKNCECTGEPSTNVQLTSKVCEPSNMRSACLHICKDGTTRTSWCTSKCFLSPLQLYNKRKRDICNKLCKQKERLEKFETFVDYKIIHSLLNCSHVPCHSNNKSNGLIKSSGNNW